jgi:hypothetical protein
MNISRSLTVAGFVAVVAAIVVGGRIAGAQGLMPYTYAPGGYTISFPIGWEQRVLATGPIALSQPQFPGDTFRENVNVVHEQLPSMMNSMQYAMASLPAMTTQLQAFAIIEQGQVIPGNPTSGYYIVYQHTMNQRLQAIAYFQTGVTRGYVVTCTALPHTFEQFRAIFAQVAMTFMYNRGL